MPLIDPGFLHDAPSKGDSEDELDVAEVAAWLAGAGFEVTRVAAPSCLVWAIARYEQPPPHVEVPLEVFVTPRAEIPDQVVQDGFDFLHGLEVEVNDLEGSVDAEARDSTEWVLGAFLRPGHLRHHLQERRIELPPVHLVVSMFVNQIPDRPYGQDILDQG